MVAKLFLLIPILTSIVLLGQFFGISTNWTLPLSLLAWLAIAYFCRLKHAALLTASIATITLTAYLAQSPSHQRNWLPEVSRLPSIKIGENLLTVQNLRDFAWSSTETFQERWINATFKLDKLNGLNAIVVPFGGSQRAAHVMLSFSFDDSEPLIVSVEARREIGEAYSLIGGAARQFELIYLIGTESDLLGLRIEHRGDQVYSLPLKVDTDFAKQLLLDLCQSANQLRQQPKFYATLRHNCTTTLLRHVNQRRETPIGFTIEILFPAQLGKMLHRLGYLDTNLDWPEAEETFRIDQKFKQPPTALSQVP